MRLLIVTSSVLCFLASVTSGQPDCRQATSEAFSAPFGSGNASMSNIDMINQALGDVVDVESGKSTAPLPVQQAFLESAKNDPSEGFQTVGYGGFPWTPNSGRTDPNTLPASSEAIVESDGSIPTCEVTVQLRTLYNTSEGDVVSVLNLIFTNWGQDDVPAPWKTVINGAYSSLSGAYNADIDVARGRVIQASVTQAPVPANGTASVPVTLLVQAAIGTPSLVPTSVFQNGRKCTLLTVGKAAFGDEPEAAGTEAYEQPISVSGRNIIGVSGNVLKMKGVNWFGFDDGVTMPEGLWVNGGAIERDFATITQRILLLGFNAVRLPFSMADIFNKSPKSCIQKCRFPSGNQEILDGLTKSNRRRALLQVSTEATCVDRSAPGGYTCKQQKAFGKCNAKFLRNYCKNTCGRCGASSPKRQPSKPKPKTPPAGGCTDRKPPGKYSCQQQKSFGKCKAGYMKNYCNKTCGRCKGTPPRKTPPKKKTPSRPRASGSNQRVAVELRSPPKNGSPGVCNSYLPADSTFNRFVYVVQFLARNGLYVVLDNQFNLDTTAITNPSEWVKGWTRIARAVNNDQTTKNRVIYDILNEPDAFKLKFEPQNNRPGMNDLMFRAFDAIYAENSKAVLMIEGLGQQNYGNLNWGDGLITDPDVIKRTGISDPNPMFKKLLTKPYRKQVVVGVHVYPPSISSARNQNTAANGLYPRLSLAHGYLNKKGYCNGQDCQIFPVVYGEMGSAFQDPRDIQWLNDMVAYMRNEGSGADGKHNSIDSWFWWSWNANSGDTGGILAQNWNNIVFRKVDYLTRIGLVPWYNR